MFARGMSEKLREMGRVYPVVTLMGPRQAGKTTLVRATFPEYEYCNLDNPEIRTLAEEDPRGFFRRFEAPLIIDEIQRVPELLSWIQVRVDEMGGVGHYVLTGSHQLRLHESVSQSLAGRTAVLGLWPFSFRELEGVAEVRDKATMMQRGFLPRLYASPLAAFDGYRDYYRTYVERDVRQLIQLKSLVHFERFVKLLAGRVGQLVNCSNLAGEVGVSSVTIAEWLSILEASYVIFRVPPYYRNFGKRMIKSAKIYFVEPGLAAWLLGIESPDQALRDPLHGNLFENMVVADFAKEFLNRGREAKMYFGRDSNGNEVDLILERQRRLVPVEIKSAMTWNSEFVKGVRWLQRTSTEVDAGYVVFAGELQASGDGWRAVHFADVGHVMDELYGD